MRKENYVDILKQHLKTSVRKLKLGHKCVFQMGQQHTTLHTTAVLFLKLSRVGPGQSLDGRPDAAGSGVGPVGGTLSYGLKKYHNAPGQ
jgi:hypothetical protein